MYIWNKIENSVLRHLKQTYLAYQGLVACWVVQAMVGHSILSDSDLFLLHNYNNLQCYRYYIITMNLYITKNYNYVWLYHVTIIT